MNTDTGRIYEPEEMERRQRFRENPELLDQLASAAEKLRELEEQREFEKASAEGKIVPVSDHVAKLMQKAQAAEKAEAVRIERRKAARAARRKDRP